MNSNYLAAGNAGPEQTLSAPVSGARQRAVIGLDLSLTATGVCVITDGKVQVSTVKSKPDGLEVSDFARRCRGIVDGIAAEIYACDPETALIVVEGLSLHSKSSSLDRIFASWYLILSDLFDRFGQEAVRISPNQRALYATGLGNASKDAVLLSAAKRYPEIPIKDNNQADALVIAAMGARFLGHPLEASLPVKNLTAMDAISWPTRKA